MFVGEDIADVDFNHITADTNKLISMVEERPCLYDLKAPEYSDVLARNAAWQEICEHFVGNLTLTKESFKTTELILKKKWRNIRDRYKKDLERMKDGAISRSQYRFAPQLHFLDKLMLGKLSLPPTKSGLMIQACDPTPEPTIDVRAATSIVRRTSQPSKRKPIASRHSLLVPKEEPDELLESGNLLVFDNAQLEYDVTPSSPKRSRAEPPDGDRHFLLSLEPYLKLVPVERKLHARSALTMVLQKYI